MGVIMAQRASGTDYPFASVENDNFIVLGPADVVEGALETADAYRRQIAMDWLGRELRPGEARAHIYLHLDGSVDQSLLHPANPENGRPHILSLATTRADLERALAHELAHVVLRARNSARALPRWADEGIASAYDDRERHLIRRQILVGFVEAGNWPPLAAILQAERISMQDQAAYAVAASLTEFLLQEADRETFLTFLDHGQTAGWDQALAAHYRISGVGDLQLRWQRWVADQPSASIGD